MIKRFLQKLFLAAALSSCSAAGNTPVPGTLPPQFVNLTFDGGFATPYWEDSLSFAKERGIKFTYFINTAALIIKGEHGIHETNLPFFGKELIDRSLELARRSVSQGHEIAWHGATHFLRRGSEDYWRKEFKIMRAIFDEKLRGLPLPLGFRAPYLAWTKSLLSISAETGMIYDSSQLLRPECTSIWPYKLEGEMLEFPLRQWRDSAGRIKSTMDYHSYYADLSASLSRKAVQKITKDMYLELFFKLYHGSRAPLVIITHLKAEELFQGAYYEALKSFADEVCILKDVRCVTIKETADWITANGYQRKLEKSEQRRCIMNYKRAST